MNCKKLLLSISILFINYCFFSTTILSNETITSKGYPGLQLQHPDSQIRFFGGETEKWAIGSTGAIGNDFLIYDMTRKTPVVIINEQNGNIGIGTNSPSRKLEIQDTNPIIHLNSNSTQGWPGIEFSAVRNSGESSKKSWNFIYNARDDNLYWYNFNLNKVAMALYDSGSIFLDGNVGIGTKSPSAKLDVNGRVKVSNEESTITIGQWDGSTNRIEGGYNKDLLITSYGDALRLGMSGGTQILLNKVGNVGIGTKSPSAKLHVNGRVKVSNEESTIAIGQWDGSTNRIEGGYNKDLLITSYGDALRLGMSGGTQILLNKAGNVGIGTNSPSAKFNVKATSYPDKNELLTEFTAGTNSPLAKRYVKLSQTYTGSSWDGIPLVWETNADSSNKKSYGAIQTLSNGAIRFLNKPAGPAIAAGSNLNVSEKMRINTNGNVGIGTNSPLAKLDVNGVIQSGSNSTRGGIFLHQKYAGNDIINSLSSNYSSGSMILGYGVAGMANQGASGHLVSTYDNFNGYRSALRIGSGTLEFLASDTKLQTPVGNEIKLSSRLFLDRSGNIGIGTKSPSAKLDVNGVIQSGSNSTRGGIFLHQKYAGNDIINSLSSNYSSGSMILGYGVAGMANQGASGHLVSTYDNFNGYRSALRIGSGTLEFLASDTKLQTPVGNEIKLSSRLFLDRSGNIGIGTNSPSAKFNVKATSYPDKNELLTEFTAGTNSPLAKRYVKLSQTYTGSSWDGIPLVWETNADSSNKKAYGAIQTLANGDIRFLNKPAGSAIAAGSNLNVVEQMRINTNGNVGIGTNSPQHKLHVNGTIYANEFNSAWESWADKVFEESYKLRSLEDLATFIKTNKHLPEIPSEDTIIKKGIGLKALQVKFLTKIEENVLYILQLKKENKQLHQELSLLKKEHQSLKTQLSTIEKRLTILEQ